MLFVICFNNSIISVLRQKQIMTLNMKCVSRRLFEVLKGKYSLKLCCKLKRAKYISFSTCNGLSLVMSLVMSREKTFTLGHKQPYSIYYHAD